MGVGFSVAVERGFGVVFFDAYQYEDLIMIYGSLTFPGASYDHWKTTEPPTWDEYEDCEDEPEPDYAEIESLDAAFQTHLAICAVAARPDAAV